MARRPFFSGNYGSALGSTAQAADIIARAGQQRGQALAGMGAQIGGMIQQYGLNKEKRNKAEAAFQGTIGRMSQTPEGAERLLMMQNDPVIGKDLKAIQEGQGKMKNFDNVNAFMAGDREQEMQSMARENAMLKQRMAKALEGPTVRKGKAEASIAEQEANYAQENDRLRRELLEGNINLLKVRTIGEASKLFGTDAPSADLEEQYSELINQLPIYDKTPIKVRTKGTFGLGSEEKTITYGEYKENPEDYSDVVNSDQLRALQMKEESTNSKLANIILDQPVLFRNNETGQEGEITLRERIEHEKQRRELLENLQKGPPNVPLGSVDELMLDQPGTTIGKDGLYRLPNLNK